MTFDCETKWLRSYWLISIYTRINVFFNSFETCDSVNVVCKKLDGETRPAQPAPHLTTILLFYPKRPRFCFYIFVENSTTDHPGWVADINGSWARVVILFSPQIIRPSMDRSSHVSPEVNRIVSYSSLIRPSQIFTSSIRRVPGLPRERVYVLIMFITNTIPIDNPFFGCYRTGLPPKKRSVFRIISRCLSYVETVPFFFSDKTFIRSICAPQCPRKSIARPNSSTMTVIMGRNDRRGGGSFRVEFNDRSTTSVTCRSRSERPARVLAPCLCSRVS